MVETTAVDHEALELFERSLRGLLPSAGVAVDDALEQVGWRDFLGEDAAAVVPLLFTMHGELLLASTALDDVAFEVLRLDRTGDATGAFAHPRRGDAAAAIRDDELVVDALVLGKRRGTPLTMVLGSDAVTVPATALERAPVQGIDPSLGLVHVHGAVARADVTMHRDVAGAAVEWACRRALAYEVLGTVDAMLATATDYAQVRSQFGQPIGAFQAVKHRLADVYVARRAAGSVVAESWHADPEVMTLAAKALAFRAGALAAEHCLQVLGAIGFTLEHDLHRFVRRVRVLDQLYGTERETRTALGRVLLAQGRVPRPGSV